MNIYKRTAISAKLKKYDYIADEEDFIEVIEWKNGEGFDVEIVSSKLQTRFQLTWGEFKALKKLIKKLENVI